MEIIRHDVRKILIQDTGEIFFLLSWGYKIIETLKNCGKERHSSAQALFGLGPIRWL